MDTLRVGFLGYGNIGSTVAQALFDGSAPGLEAACALGRSAPLELAVSNLDELVAHSDVILEAASQSALRSATLPVLEAGRTLVALSVGAFLGDDLWTTLFTPHAGRLVLCPGAIGGIELLRSLRLADERCPVALRTTKKPETLVQPWMGPSRAEALRRMAPGDRPEIVFRGSTMEAAERFPRNLNVAASLAIAVRDRQLVDVTLVADADARRTRHEISVSAPSGNLGLVCESPPSNGNPSTSTIVPYAALRTLMDLRVHGPSRFG